ncbi:unnamed protein product [Chironomus riparius]|uniref:Uncharacterized protein n=1 Tax=Chironomus riparius TaxID=315576 RepID=A0A9N9WP80_9DIPT|nr:unnamed protein product [Chironomus riparius]
MNQHEEVEDDRTSKIFMDLFFIHFNVFHPNHRVSQSLVPSK